MANTISPNMGLVIPGVGTEIGPNWANDLNGSLSTIDGHNHTPGSGVQITTQGLNINADLPMNLNNLITIRSIRWTPQSGILIGSSDVGCAYVNGVDLYFNDVNGNAIRMTQGGGVAGAPGNISGLVPPATFSYISINKTFVAQSGVNIPASFDGGNVILRNITANSKGVTLSPVSSLATNYTLTLPTIPATQTFLTIDTSGNISAPWTLDPNYLTVISNLITLSTLGQQSLVPSGTILSFGGTTAPAGYLMCDGTSYLQSAFPTLFSTIGTAYGSSDSTHFNVPDTRGQFLRGVSGTTNVDPDKASRTASNPGGNAGDLVGSAQSFATQSHSHGISLGTAGGNGSNVQGCNTGIAFSNGTGGNSGNSSSETRPTNLYVNYMIKI